MKLSLKKKELTLDEVQEKLQEIYDEYKNSDDLEEANNCVLEIKSPLRNTELISLGLTLCFEGKPNDREQIPKLFCYLFEKNTLTLPAFIDSFKLSIDSIEDIDIDIPFASQYLGDIIGILLANSVFSFDFLSNLTPIVDSGKAAVVVTSALQICQTLKSKEFVTQNFKLNIVDFFKDKKKCF